MKRSLLAVSVSIITLFCVGDIAAGYINIGVAPHYGSMRSIDASRSVFVKVSDTGRKAGLRSGDILDNRRWTVQQRLFAWLGYAPAGTAFDLAYVRGKRQTSARETFVAQPQRAWLNALDVVLRLLLAGSGILLLARGKDWGSIAGGLALCGWAIFEGFGETYAGPAWLTSSMTILNAVANVCGYAGLFFFGVYILPERTPRTGRYLLYGMFAIFFACELFFALGLKTLIFFGTSLVASDTIFYALAKFLTQAALVALYATAAVYVRGRDATAVRIVFVAMLVSSMGSMFTNFARAIGVQPFDVATNLSWLTIAIAFPYAVFVRRLVALDFVVSRAAVYAIVLSIVIGVFVFAENLIARAALGRIESVTLALVLPLVLGFSIRWIERGADHVVVRFLYRDKLRAAQEFEALVEDFPHARDARILAARVATEIHQYMHSAFVCVYRELDGVYTPVASSGQGTSLPVSADDPVFMRLRSKRQTVHTEDFATALPRLGVVSPLVVFGTVTGAVYCQFRESGERFDPDELETLQKLAHELAIALLWVDREPARSVPSPALRGS